MKDSTIYNIDSIASKRSNLLLIISIILVGSFVLSCTASIIMSRNILKQELVNEKLPLISDKIYSKIKIDLLPFIIVSSDLANDYFLKQFIKDDSKNREDVFEYLEAIKKRYNASTCFVASDKTKNYFDSNRNILKETRDIQTAGWYYDFKESGKEYELNSSIDVDPNKTPTIFINHRVVDNESNFIGVAGLGIEFDTIPKVLAEYNGKYNRNIYFIDSRGTVIASSDSFASKIKDLYSSKDIQESLDKVYSEETDFFDYRDGSKAYTVSAKYVPELDWWLFVEQNDAKVIDSVNSVVIVNAIISIASIIVTLILVAIMIGRYHRRIKSLATLDRLTGISNRLMFEYTLTQAIAKYKRDKKLFSLLLIDLDYFKKINDTYGHLKGDQVLKKSVEIIGGIIRESDEFCRWGGEEFMLLANDCKLKDAVILAEKIRVAIEDSQLIEDKLTLSIGVSEARSSDNNDTLINRADEALYLAKKSGRNCVKSY